MDLKATFARNVRRVRHAEGMTQDDLGDLSGLTRNYIGMIERAETSPTLDSVEAICTALNRKAFEMFNLSDCEL